VRRLVHPAAAAGGGGWVPLVLQSQHLSWHCAPMDDPAWA